MKVLVIQQILNDLRQQPDRERLRQASFFVLTSKKGIPGRRQNVDMNSKIKGNLPVIANLFEAKKLRSG